MTLQQVLEALLFASPRPLTIADMRTVLKAAAEFSEYPLAGEFARSRDEDVRSALDALATDYREQGRAFELAEGAAGWQINSVAACAPWVRQLFPENRPARLSPAALETLAIIAYRQPVARADVEAVRGVDAGGVVQTLLDRGLIRIAGRAEVPGRPLLYATTQLFLEHFGVKQVNELPAFDELRTTLLAKEAAHAEPAPPAETPAPGNGSEAAESPQTEPAAS
jgi:segregation and condensation protein B